VETVQVNNSKTMLQVSARIVNLHALLATEVRPKTVLAVSMENISEWTGHAVRAKQTNLHRKLI